MRHNSKYSKQSNNPNPKRSKSPFGQQQPVNSQNNKSNSNKKILNYSPYQKVIKQFESHGKSGHKKIQEERDRQRNHKFRILTQPVDDRIMHLAQNNIFNSSIALRNPSTYNVNSKKKIETEVRESTQNIRLNLRNQNSSQSRSKQKIYLNSNTYNNSRSGQGLYSRKIDEENYSIGNQNRCLNCVKYAEQLQYLHYQIKKIMKAKQQWKNGEAAYDQIKKVFGDADQSSSISKPDSSNNNRKAKSRNSRTQFKFADAVIKQIKCNMADLIKDIEALSSIDYPKMLSMDIFSLEQFYNQEEDPHENQLKELFSQLRASVQGKIIDYDTYDTESQNTYTKMIMRNMKSRLNFALRQNLDLKIRKAILEKSEQISEESEQYLRAVIQQVLHNYSKRR